MLEIADLRVAIKGSDVLRNVNLEVPDGMFAALVGRNGAGKTTLMRAVMGLQPITGGVIRTGGVDTTHLPAYLHVERGTGYMPDDRRLVGLWTVEQNILLPAWASKDRAAPENLKRVYALIPELEAHKDRKALQLSGGQQKLVALARAMLCGHRLLLLDEPFEGIAPALAERLVEVLANLRRDRRCTVLVTESDFVHSHYLIDHAFEIERGAVRKL
jgi:branched-chain amino acid transport system ATP-binding protein